MDFMFSHGKQDKRAAHIQTCALMATEFVYTGRKPKQEIFNQCRYTNYHAHNFGVMVMSRAQRLIGTVISLALFREYRRFCENIATENYHPLHENAIRGLSKIFFDATGSYGANQFQDVVNTLNETFVYDTSYIQNSGTKLVCGYVSNIGDMAARIVLQHPADQGIIIGQFEVITT